jgi:ribosome-binding protein aMBF1 (putative translation factor)
MCLRSLSVDTSFSSAIREEAERSGPAALAHLDDLVGRFTLACGLLTARRAAGLAQGSLAAACGISQAELSRIERAQANPRLRTITVLAAALDTAVVLGGPARGLRSGR